MKRSQIVMIAGGGTGGHIYPAIAIGRALKKIDPEIQLRFVGTADGLETKILQRENLALDLIQSGQLNLSGQLMTKIKTLLKIPMGFLQSVRLLKQYQPCYVLGVGGYASAPFVLAASLMRFQTALWEPNAHPGMANRILSKFVNRSYLVFNDAQKYLSTNLNKTFGMPLREEVDQAALEGGKKNSSESLTLLCFGGSQGSLFLNEQISDFVLSHPELHSKLKIIHQTGTRDFEKMKKKYSHLECVEIHEFIYDMPTYYRRADIAFCRGGASTIAEVAAFGVVPVIVPLPAADDHQLRNAEVVVQNQAGYLIKQSEFNQQKFYEMIMLFINDVKLRQDMSAVLKKMAPYGAAAKIAEDILQQIRSTKLSP